MSLLRAVLPVLLVCAAVGATTTSAAGPDDWVPARWEGGPLELQRRARNDTLPGTASAREAIAHWYDIATLDLLRDTPVNCLLVTWSIGADTTIEREHQHAVTAYVQAARARGIAVLGLVHAPASPASVLEPAIAAGLDGLFIEGGRPDADRLASELRRSVTRGARPLLIVSPTSWSSVAPASDIVAVSDAIAPGLQEMDEEAQASPSSEPWIDSNLWLVQSVRARVGPRPIWVMASLPAEAAPSDYQRAIADAAAAGGRWVLALGDDLRQHLRMNRPEARATWKAIADTLAEQQAHARWHGRSPLAVTGFIQDSAGADREVAGANLRLAVRARVPLRVIDREHLDVRALEGLRAVHAIDLATPTSNERALLTAFTQAGGLLIVGPSWQQPTWPAGQDYVIVPTGKGRIAICREGLDAAELARVFVDLLGREHLGVRLFRAASVLPHASVDAASGDVVVHLVNYATHPAEAMVVRVNGEFGRAWFHRPGSPPEELQVDRSGGRVEVTLGRLSVYGIVRLEKRQGGA